MRTWQLPGRGRRLKCQRKVRGVVLYPYNHNFHSCRWCGQSIADPIPWPRGSFAFGKHLIVESGFITDEFRIIEG